ncbi:MAG: hypothetical protein M1279_02545 [Candidatus Marsarchaeota archaeon]|nr:hypothetical protein [Candidatus Marsarchaeota archaeon]
MSLEKALDDEMKKPGFGTANCHLSFKERPHISKSKVDMADGATYINIGESFRARYSAISAKYIASVNMTYDLLLSVYDVDTKDLFAMRVLKHATDTFKALEKYTSGISRNKYKRFEARLIGMQNKQDYSILMPIFKILGRYKVPVVEVDLFGDQIRHIALETFLGVSFNVLLLDRIYRPGELNNQMTHEQLEAQLMKSAASPVKK